MEVMPAYYYCTSHVQGHFLVLSDTPEDEVQRCGPICYRLLLGQRPSYQAHPLIPEENQAFHADFNQKKRDLPHPSAKSEKSARPVTLSGHRQPTSTSSPSTVS